MNIFQFIIPKSLVTTITDDSTVRQALEKMKFHRYTALPVLDREGKYVGTVREGDLFRYFLDRDELSAKSAEQDPVRLLLRPGENKPLFHTASMRDLIEQVTEHNFVPVVDDRGCFIGMILRREVLSFLLRYFPEEPEEDTPPAPLKHKA